MTWQGPLVNTAWLRERQGEPGLRIVDLRWYLDGRSGAEAYREGHLPGAVFIDLDKDITGVDGPGRHPLPDADRFEVAMRRAGISTGDAVAVYDDQGGFSAARLWFLLRYFGHERVALLDGGFQAWQGTVETGDGAPPPAGDFRAGPPHREWIVDRAAVAGRAAATILLDARAGERFRGEIEPIYPRAGHIPGALNAFWKDNLNSDLTFKKPADLREQYSRLGVGEGCEVVASCGSGVSACVDILALELAGIRGVRLFEGSFSEWSAAPDMPVATGPS